MGDTTIRTIGTTADVGATNHTCLVASRVETQVAWGTFSGVGGAINIFMVICMIRQWGILRQNVTYYYVMSCLLSSVVFCLFTIYEVILTMHYIDIVHLSKNGSFRYNPEIPGHTDVMNGAAFRKAFLPALFIIIQLNVVSLIYGVSDNAFFVGRYGDRSSLSKLSSPGSMRRGKKFLAKNHKASRKRVKAAVAIVLSWLLPFFITLPVPLGWNCNNYCACLPIITDKPYCVPSPESGVHCSRLWHPLTGSYVAAITGVWSLGMILMFALLVNTILKFYRTHTPRASRPQEKKTSEQSVNSDASENISRSCRNESLDSVDGKASIDSPKPRSATSVSAVISRFHERPPLDPVVKMLIVLSLCSFVFVFPLQLVWVLDALVSSDTAAELPFNITLALSFIYATTLPGLLVWYMSGLRKAIVATIVTFPCVQTTVVTSAKESSLPRSKATTSEIGASVAEGREDIAVVSRTGDVETPQ